MDKILDRIAERLWRFFSSMKLALSLFIALVVSTMIGSIVLQRPIAEPGQLERAYSPETIVWLDRFGFLDVFHSWWFLLQMALLAVNITVVSIDMWPKFRARLKSFSPVLTPRTLPGFSESIPLKTSSDDFADGLVASLKSLVRRKFRNPQVTVVEGRTHIAAQSAQWAHLGVYVIHVGVLLVLIGGMITGAKGFEGQIPLSPGESSDFYFDRAIPGKKTSLGFTLRCTGARMDRYPDGSPKAYFSDLEILEGDRVVAKKTIKVNDPLSYKGIYFYQATFGQKPVNEKTSITIDVRDTAHKGAKPKVFVTDFEKSEALPGSKGKFQVMDYAESVPLDVEGHKKDLGEAVKILLSEDGEEPKMVWLFKNYPDFDRDIRKGRYHFTFHNFEYDYQVENVTGIQVAKNPGIDITWIGSALLLAGLLSTFWVPHRKLWVVVGDGEITVAGASHRHPETFEKKLKKIVEQIKSMVNPASSSSKEA